MLCFEYAWLYISRAVCYELLTREYDNWVVKEWYKSDALNWIVTVNEPRADKLSMIIWDKYCPARDQYFFSTTDVTSFEYVSDNLSDCKAYAELYNNKIK